MNELLNLKILPLKGIGEINLYQKLNDTKKYLESIGIKYKVQFWPNKGCTPEVPWTIIEIGEDITLFFAKEKLWKIVLENGFKGSLPNGIKLGMDINTALKIDNTLIFNELDEVFQSDECYWIEDNLDNECVESISLVIKEANNDDIFYKYEW